MLQYLHSTKADPTLAQDETLRRNSWIRCEKPTETEISQLISLGIDADLLSDALDPHEVPRVELEDGWTYFITRLPDTDNDFNDFTTPVLFAIGQEHIATISRDPLGRLWQPFIDRTQAQTGQRTTLFMLMVETIVRQYQTRVTRINRQMRVATDDVRNLRARDIATLTEYERKLNDYLDALQPTNTSIEKLLGGRLLPLREDDRDLVEDLSVDLEQLISRCKSLLRTITNTRDSYRAVIDTQLNETVRILTVITLALTIPTMMAGLFGMNVDLPGEDWPYTFWVIIGASVLAAASLSYYFIKRR
jgi:magnesium transporter